MKIEAGRTRLTKEMIVSILKENNTINRPIKRANIEKYKTELINGTFVPNGQGDRFIFSKEDDILRDGQHRLIAMAETGIIPDFDFDFVVVDKKYCSSLDGGVARSVVDNLRILFHNDKYMNSITTNTNVSVARLYYCVKKNAALHTRKDMKLTEDLACRFLRNHASTLKLITEATNNYHFLAPEKLVCMFAVESHGSTGLTAVETLARFYATSQLIGLEGKGFITVREKRLLRNYPFNSLGSGIVPVYETTQLLLYKILMRQPLRVFRPDMLGQIYFKPTERDE